MRFHHWQQKPLDNIFPLNFCNKNRYIPRVRKHCSSSLIFRTLIFVQRAFSVLSNYIYMMFIVFHTVFCKHFHIKLRMDHPATFLHSQQSSYLSNAFFRFRRLDWHCVKTSETDSRIIRFLFVLISIYTKRRLYFHFFSAVSLY
jgi:hypothetical protein